MLGNQIDEGHRWEENLLINTLLYMYINVLSIYKVDLRETTEDSD